MIDREQPQISLGILIGGKSKRFGSDKYRFELEGESLLQRAHRVASPLAQEVLIAAGDQSPDISVSGTLVRDHYAGGGPLAGIHACLKKMSHEWLLVLACDLPFITTASLQRLVESTSSAHQVVMASSAEFGEQPLCACYHHSLLLPVQEALSNSHFGVFEFLRGEPSVLELTVPDGELLNLNRPGDLFLRD